MRCGTCPIRRLGPLVAENQRMIKHGFTVCNAIQAGFAVDWLKLPVDIFRAAVIIKSEHNRKEAEDFAVTK